MDLLLLTSVFWHCVTQDIGLFMFLHAKLDYQKGHLIMLKNKLDCEGHIQL